MVSGRSQQRRRRAFGTASLIAVAGLLASTQSCGSSFMDGLVGGHRDDGANGDASKPDARSCRLATPPDRPDAADDPKNVQLSFAFETLRLDSKAEVDFGLDLDRTCTCPEPESCTPWDAGASSSRRCDGDGGRDNALAGFFERLGTLVPELREDFASRRIREGRFTVLVEVRGWNGQPNDPSVTVALRTSQGLDPAATAGPPAFDGNDVWTVAPESILEGQSALGMDCRATPCVAKVIALDAFVTDGTLVAKVRDPSSLTTSIVIRTGLGPITFELLDATFVAKITSESGRYKLTGALVGRWPVASILSALATLENPFIEDESLCRNGQGAYTITKASVCGALDLAAESRLDGVSNTPCSAMSSTLSFTASQAVAGHIFAEDRPDGGCGDFKDDCTQ